MKYYPIRMYLVEARNKLSYSQYRAAQAMHVSHQHYNRIENGKIGSNIQFRTINALSVALHLPIDVIWEEEIKYQLSLIDEDGQY